VIDVEEAIDILIRKNNEIEELADLQFAFVNCDPDCPHDFERTAYERAEEILVKRGKTRLPWEKVRPNDSMNESSESITGAAVTLGEY
jgi:hypothetical protein